MKPVYDVIVRLIKTIESLSWAYRQLSDFLQSMQFEYSGKLGALGQTFSKETDPKAEEQIAKAHKPPGPLLMRPLTSQEMRPRIAVTGAASFLPSLAKKKGGLRGPSIGFCGVWLDPSG
ncbi:hypothetical protein NPIL_691511 [Nephila pilipes]|uniref:Uncharacterized protein n=1 Tax=Nephila pilipes TaxID=299642 RepID=A0A8X6QPA3_NEPPI|nr:hypothetical protein NPIL_691511 [Nephila pilipes]